MFACWSRKNLPPIAIDPVPAGVPMNNVLLVYEYAGSATFNELGAAVAVENFS
jgi:hypothetical protein